MGFVMIDGKQDICVWNVPRQGWFWQCVKQPSYGSDGKAFDYKDWAVSDAMGRLRSGGASLGRVLNAKPRSPRLRPKVYLWHSNRYPQAFASWHWTSPDLNFPATRSLFTKFEAERDAQAMLTNLQWDFCYSAPETLTDAKTSAPEPDTTERYPSAPEQSGETTDTTEPLYVWKVTQEERELMICALTRLRDGLIKRSDQAQNLLGKIA